MNFIAHDSETWLIAPGRVAPPLVCLTWDSPGLESPQICLKSEAADVVEAWLDEPGLVLVAHNAVFDMAVYGVNFPHLLPKIFEAFRSNRIACTAVWEKLYDIATGQMFGKEYSLAACAKRRLKVDIEGKSGPDVWRYRYQELDGVPLDRWPKAAVDYATLDSTYAKALWQAGALKEGIPDDFWRQMRADWCLYLMGMWGVVTDQKMVDKLDKELHDHVDDEMAFLEKTALFRVEGNRANKRTGEWIPKNVVQDAKETSLAVVRAYTGVKEGAKGTEPHSEEALKFCRLLPHRPDVRAYVRALEHKGIALTHKKAGPIPWTDKGRVGRSAAVLLGSGDPTLIRLADISEDRKLLNTYVPLLRQKVINARYNVLVESGRTSCVAEGTMIEVVRDVSQRPEGIPIEDVREGDLVYCYDEEGNLDIKPVLWAGQTGVREVVRVHWQGSGNKHIGHVDLTPEHLVLKTDMTWCRAEDLCPNDRVMALARGTSAGYARLWATDIGEIAREHRFIEEALNGPLRDDEHVHHRNHNKQDNRPENLQRMSRREHLSHHSSNPSDDLRRKRSKNQKTRWRERRAEMLASCLRGEEHPHWLGLTKNWILKQLYRHAGKPTVVCLRYGIDYETFQKYCRHLDVDWRAVAQAFNKRGERLDREFIVRMREETKDLRVKDAAKAVGMSYYRWKDLQAEHGFKPYNHRVLRVERLPGTVPVYDLTVRDHHNFIANEICVHNCREPNLQNLPRRPGVRDCFVPRPGWWYLFADYSVAELCSLSHVLVSRYGQSEMAKVIRSGRDIHLEVAASLASLSYEEAEKRRKEGDKYIKTLRQLAKVLDFGVPGGMGAAMFYYHTCKEMAPATILGPNGKQIRCPSCFGSGIVGGRVTYDPNVDKACSCIPIEGMSYDYVKDTREAWLDRFPEVRWYFKDIGEAVDMGGGSFLAESVGSGRLRGDVQYTNGCNHFFQALTADGAKAAMWKITEACYDKPGDPLYGCRPVFFIHDEFGLEVPADYAIARPAAKRLEELMIEGMQEFVTAVPTKADACLTERWYKGAEPVYDERGQLVLWHPETK